MGALFSHCRPRDDTLEGSSFQMCIWMNNFKMDKRKILQKISRGLSMGKQTAQAEEVYWLQ